MHKKISSVKTFIYLRDWKCPSHLSWLLQAFNKIKCRTLNLNSSSRHHIQIAPQEVFWSALYIRDQEPAKLFSSKNWSQTRTPVFRSLCCLAFTRQMWWQGWASKHQPLPGLPPNTLNDSLHLGLLSIQEQREVQQWNNWLDEWGNPPGLELWRIGTSSVTCPYYLQIVPRLFWQHLLQLFNFLTVMMKNLFWT